MKLDNAIEHGEVHYAGEDEVREVVQLLIDKLGEDKVTTGDDERLGHGQSPNTYHGS
jgi:hypothetical protein